MHTRSHLTPLLRTRREIHWMGVPITHSFRMCAGFKAGYCTCAPGMQHQNPTNTRAYLRIHIHSTPILILQYNQLAHSWKMCAGVKAEYLCSRNAAQCRTCGARSTAHCLKGRCGCNQCHGSVITPTHIRSMGGMQVKQFRNGHNKEL